MTEQLGGAAAGGRAATPGAQRRGRAGLAALGAVGGVVAGVAITWGVVSANAASTTPGAATGSAPSSSTTQPAFHGHDGGLGTSGTVTAVGTSSVTIKTSSGTKTYKVSSSSDIDKNGEAKLSDLKAGDAVRFDTDTVNGATVIDHLHAGSEALDRPTG
jgi:hypothetical protein